METAEGGVPPFSGREHPFIFGDMVLTDGRTGLDRRRASGFPLTLKRGTLLFHFFVRAPHVKQALLCILGSLVQPLCLLEGGTDGDGLFLQRRPCPAFEVGQQGLMSPSQFLRVVAVLPLRGARRAHICRGALEVSLLGPQYSSKAFGLS